MWQSKTCCWNKRVENVAEFLPGAENKELLMTDPWIKSSWCKLLPLKTETVRKLWYEMTRLHALTKRNLFYEWAALALSWWATREQGFVHSGDTASLIHFVRSRIHNFQYIFSKWALLYERDWWRIWLLMPNQDGAHTFALVNTDKKQSDPEGFFIQCILYMRDIQEEGVRLMKTDWIFSWTVFLFSSIQLKPLFMQVLWSKLTSYLLISMFSPMYQKNRMRHNNIWNVAQRT